MSRHIFQPLFPRWPQPEVPIGSVTNGIHVPTWDSAEADALWTEACGSKRWRGDSPVEEDIRQLTDAQLWQMRTRRESDDRRVRKRMRVSSPRKAEIPSDADTVFDENVLTIGFARRFATYKRPNLLLHDPDRLLRILTDRQRPVQLILAGKAHPQDQPGRR